MFERIFVRLRDKNPEIFGGLLLSVLLLAAYSNHFQNSFHFDDAHTIVNNAAIRELKNIPRFFIDATTFSSLPSNQSYRPIVSTLFAIDYAIGHLKPFWFHLSIFALFIVLVLVLVIVIERLLENEANSGNDEVGKQVRAGGTPAPDARDGRAPRNWLIALIAAAWYGLHPANADTVNYIIASAEIISALGIAASFAVYAAYPQLRQYYIYVLPAAIAILAKPPAAIFPVLFAVYLVLFSESLAKRRLTEIAVSFLFCASLLLVVQAMTPKSWVAGARDAHDYLITQPYVALLYFKTFFWPGDLSADYDLNAFTTTDDSRFWLGFAFVILFLATAIVAVRFRKTRLIGFGLLWFLIALLPTSLFPLAEVMNDHRTFLPYIGLVIAVAGAVSLLVNRRVTYGLPAKIAATCAVALFLCANGYATFQRNKVWKTEETLWHDVTLKSPRNGRGLMNYGNTLMAKGDFAGALDYFHRAQKLTPEYSVLLINLAVAEDATKQDALAEQHFKEALRLAPANPESYTYYARYLLSHSRPREARGLLQRALQLSPTDLTARELIAQTNGKAVNEPATQTPESYLELSLQLYNEGRFIDSIAASRHALDLRPGYAEAWNNIGAAYNKLGRYKEAVAACEQALRFKPDFDLARNNLQYAREKLRQSLEPANGPPSP
jgi:Flp pilus assembly protein TadD